MYMNCAWHTYDVNQPSTEVLRQFKDIFKKNSFRIGHNQNWMNDKCVCSIARA